MDNPGNAMILHPTKMSNSVERRIGDKKYSITFRGESIGPSLPPQLHSAPLPPSLASFCLSGPGSTVKLFEGSSDNGRTHETYYKFSDVPESYPANPSGLSGAFKRLPFLWVEVSLLQLSNERWRGVRSKDGRAHSLTLIPSHIKLP